MGELMSLNHNDIIAVTNRSLCERPFLEQIERVCRFKPKALILREKDLPENEYERIAKQVMEVCGRYDLLCILHSFPQTAVKLNCRAIHLPLTVLKKSVDMLDNFDIVGTSVHSVEDALEAQRLGADYVTAGHIYETDCKKGLPPRGLEFLKNVCDSVDIPVYGIGGIKINEEQIEEVKKCGASGGCIMSGMMRL